MIWEVVHQMFLKEDYTWSCPECGRTIQFYPEFKIVESGDTSVKHYGSSGGLSVGVEVQSKNERDS